MHVGGFAAVLATALAVNSVSAKDDNHALRKLQDSPGFSEDQQMLWLDRFSFFRVAGLPYSAANMNQLVWDDALAATAAEKAPTTCEPLLEGTTFEPGFLYHQQPTEGFDPATAVDNAIDEWVKNTAQSTLADLPAPKATGDPVGEGFQNSYSQVVWAAAKKVGCSYSVCSHDSVTTGIVCAFDAASDGSAWYKFGSPTKMCPDGTIGANAMCVEQGQENYFQEVEASVPLESRANEVYAGFITLVKAEEEATDAKPPEEDETTASAAVSSESTANDSDATPNAAEVSSQNTEVSALDEGNQGAAPEGAEPAAAEVTDPTAEIPVSEQGSEGDTLDGADPAGAVPAATPVPGAAVDNAAATNAGSAGAAAPGTGSAAKPAEDPVNEDGASMYQNPTEGDGEQTPAPSTTAPAKEEENASPETEESSAPAQTPPKQSVLTPSPALASQPGSLEGTNASPPSQSSASAASTPKPTTKAPSTADTPTFSQAEDPSTSKSSSQGSASIGKPASSTGDKPVSSKDDESASPGGVVPAAMDGNQDQGKVTGASQGDDDHFTNAKKPETSAPSPSEDTPTNNVNNQSGAASASSGLSPAGIAGVIVVGVVVAAGGFVFAGYKKNQAKQRSILESGGLHVL